MNIRRKLAIAGIGLLGVVGVGAGVSSAQSSPPSTVATPAASAPISDATTAESTTTAEAPEVAGVEEPGDANLPGGGHADPAGANVDHQFEGVE